MKLPGFYFARQKFKAREMEQAKKIPFFRSLSVKQKFQLR
jgi:hypothetical protein